jgi:hypothetical protein
MMLHDLNLARNFTPPPPARTTSITYATPDPDYGNSVDHAKAKQHGIDPSKGRSWFYSAAKMVIPQ